MGSAVQGKGGTQRVASWWGEPHIPWSSYRIEGVAPSCKPLLVFLNTKSGPQIGSKIRRRLLRLLNPIQVLLLAFQTFHSHSNPTEVSKGTLALQIFLDLHPLFSTSTSGVESWRRQQAICVTQLFGTACTCCFLLLDKYTLLCDEILRASAVKSSKIKERPEAHPCTSSSK